MKEDATFYYIVWVIVLIVALTERIRKKPFNNTIITAVFMLAAVIVACRVDVGADWYNYKFIFYNGYDNTGLRDSSSMEPVFMIIRSIFYNIGFTHAVFFLVLSLISLFAIRKAAELFGIKYFMTVFLVYYSMFFLSYQFNIVRHGLMASFVWLSFAYKSKGAIKASIISIIVALGFHVTALIFIPFLFFLNKHISKCFVFFTVIISYCAFFLQLSKRIIAFFPILSEIERTASFVTNEAFMEDYGLSLGSQIQVFLFLFLFFKNKTSYNNSPSYRMLLNALLYNFALICFLNSFSAVISRVCNALFMSMVFLLPLIVEMLKKQSIRLIAESLIVIYLFLSLPKTFVIQEDGYSEMLPYRFEMRQLVDKNAK